MRIKSNVNSDLFLILFALFLVIFFVFILIFICTRLALLCSFLCSARLCIFHWFGCCSLFLLLFLSQFSETRIQVRFPSLLCLLFIARIRLLSLINCFLCSALSFFFRNKSCNDNPSMPRSDFNVRLFL